MEQNGRKSWRMDLLQATKTSVFLHPGDVINRIARLLLHASYLFCPGFTLISTSDTSSPAIADFPFSQSSMHEENLSDHQLSTVIHPFLCRRSLVDLHSC